MPSAIRPKDITAAEDVAPAAPSHRRNRILLLTIWVIMAGLTVWLFFFRRESVQRELQEAMSVSMFAASFLYLLLSSLRGFTFMPAAPLLILGIAFFPPVPLFVLTLAGILVSSAIIYWFSGSLHLEEVFSKRYAQMMAKVHGLLHKRELPVITAWCLFPVTPTDLMVYVCGVLRIDFKKTMLGVAIGAGINCAVVIFLGDKILRYLHLKI
jgi:uncharacterized membrane protein YdjX (TVP38/TMEM64 family)